MTDTPIQPRRPATTPQEQVLTEAGAKAREERLARSAAALRENLHRRKAQARARAAVPAAPPETTPPSMTGRDRNGG
jgi:hypothetical protein